MNNNAFLEKLLQGAKVEWKTLGEVAPPIRGKRVVRAELSENGEYPVYQNSLKPLGFYTSMNCNKYTAFIIAAGAAGEIGFSDIDFWAADDCYYFECPKDRLDSKFLYYFLLKENNKLFAQVRRASIPRLGKIAIENLKIPIPPLSVQQEIVKILDTLTALTSELTSELNLRQKQYQYYRDKLLTFGDEVEWKTLGEVLYSLKTGLNPRNFFTLNTQDANNYYVTIRELKNGKIIFSEKTDRINDEALRLCNNRSNLDVGDVLFSGTGTIGETAIIESEPNNWNIKEGVYTLKPNKSYLVPKFLMYILRVENIRNKILEKVAGGTVKSIPMRDLKNIQIPIPPIEEQKRIVEILDKFDTLTNSISEGLPKEIELRNKQYEYYREMLLGFERV